MKENFKVVCAWCGEVTGHSEVADSHGICANCYRGVAGIPDLSYEEVQELPVGVIELSEDGTVLAYNRTEAPRAARSVQETVGRNFFTEIAPCSRVRDFHGQFDEFLANGAAMKHFRFTFHFDHGAVKVQVVFVRGSERRSFVVIKREESQLFA